MDAKVKEYEVALLSEDMEMRVETVASLKTLTRKQLLEKLGSNGFKIIAVKKTTVTFEIPDSVILDVYDGTYPITELETESEEV